MYRSKTTLEQWRILQAVVQHGGYAHAAEALNKSQSSLNHAVSKLQDQLGIALLEVRGRKAHLTAAGEVMLRRAKQLTQSVESLENLAESLNIGWEQQIRLAVSMSYPQADLLHVANQFFPQSRGCHLDVHKTNMSGSAALSSLKKTDLLISSDLPVGTIGQPLCTVKLLLACAPSHPLAGVATLTFEQLTPYLQVVVRSSDEDHSDEPYLQYSLQNWTVDNVYEAIDILLEGQGFAWLPEHDIRPHLENHRLIQLELAESKFKTANLQLAYPEPDNIGPAAQLFAELLLAHHQQQRENTD